MVDLCNQPLAHAVVRDQLRVLACRGVGAAGARTCVRRKAAPRKGAQQWGGAKGAGLEWQAGRSMLGRACQESGGWGQEVAAAVLAFECV